MSDTILSGDFTIYYLDDNRQKRIKWTGAASGTRTMNELYSALQDLFDESLQMDDGIPMSAQTPVEYTIGIIDAGDLNPWYISYETLQHLTGGALQTAGWTHVDTSAIGIITVPVTAASSTIVAGDIGYDISGATTGHGTLLDLIDIGATNDYLIIRPDSNAASDNFTTNSQTITCNGHTAPQAQAGSNTGEMIWANLYSLGTIEPDTHIYLYQGAIGSDERVRIYSIADQTQDWWSDGHIDICIPIKDYTTVSYDVIDGGYVTVLARKYTSLYDSYEVACSTTSGGRNPIPLAAAPDLDNGTGYKSITTTAVATDDFAIGDEIEGGSSGARAVITYISGANPTYTFHYYLIDDPQTDFQTAAETIVNNDSDGEATKNDSAPADQGPALTTWYTGAGGTGAPTATYGYATADIDDNGSNEYYGITIDCNQCPLTHVYEWIKYVTRRGATGTTNTDGIAGEMYVGGEVYLKYSGSVSGGTVDEGDDVTQATSLATGVVISHDTVNKILLLRNARGVFSTSYVVTSTDHSGSFTPNTAAQNFSAKKQAPLGTFAGGTFFGARGVKLTDWASADENQFILTPVEGGTVTRPTAIVLEVANLVGAGETAITSDRVGVFRLTGLGGSIDKTEFSAYGGETAGGAVLDVDTAIPQDVPGKTTGGVLRLRDASDNYKEYRIRYSSWLNNGGGGTDGRFTLANIDVAAADAGTDTDTIVESGAFTNAKRGDLVYNHNRTAVSYVTEVTDANTIQISPAIASQTTGDHIELNCVPIAVDTADDVYVPLIDQFATSATASVSIVYSDPIYFRVVVRNVANTTPIKPFSTDDSTSGTDRSIATIRTEDTIYT